MPNRPTGKLEWNKVDQSSPRRYDCAWCGVHVASIMAFVTRKPDAGYVDAKVHICPNCGAPTFFQDPLQHPAPAPGRPIKHLPSSVAALHSEMRQCMSVGAPTAAAMVGRKLLMNMAVCHGLEAKNEKDRAPTFDACVDYLIQRQLPPSLKPALDHVRGVGNAANHEIPEVPADDVQRLFKAVEGVMTVLYELPGDFPGQVSAES